MKKILLNNVNDIAKELVRTGSEKEDYRESIRQGENTRKTLRVGISIILCIFALTLTGCTRSQMNYQIADAIGTVGEYENNEPVETPKMVEMRKLLEESESEEQALVGILEEAEKLAAGYNYEEAIEVLDSITGLASRDERVVEAAERYSELDSAIVTWEGGDVPHLCFPSLIADTSLAFDGSSNSSVYDTSMLTCQEFTSILQSLYDNDYILIDIYSIAGMVTDERGTTSMEEFTIKIPEGKKPIVISQDNLDYSSVSDGDGIATRLVLDADGKVKAALLNADGEEEAGDYDLIPILDSFIETHPEFSFRGAHGIVSVSGSNGVFGYDLSSGDGVSTDGSDLEESQGSDGSAATSSANASSTISLAGEGSSTSSDTSFTENQTAIANISEALTSEGWHIACAGWTHTYLSDMTYDQFVAEMDNWINNVEVLTGNADILFYPYGAEVTYPSDELDYLTQNGFIYLCGLWGDTDFTQITDLYMRMTRRFIDGYTLRYASDYFTDFFDASEILDPDR